MTAGFRIPRSGDNSDRCRHVGVDIGVVDVDNRVPSSVGQTCHGGFHGHSRMKKERKLSVLHTEEVVLISNWITGGSSTTTIYIVKSL